MLLAQEGLDCSLGTALPWPRVWSSGSQGGGLDVPRHLQGKGGAAGAGGDAVS